ncbi:heterokaryon incompatibility protein-domain-containing protein [Lasiosphaeria ovina]|uniref:Heterokaryon incompatibility protein-domain-containing protein n=1 Tax=Lasiosphaeria ovina TaxID=92902 RepID=A0AAE0NDV3_9PEZI|nr:heterokaryon incompatibility protein-domain-containing protein [Lasiosphaeria ovina]
MLRITAKAGQVSVVDFDPSAMEKFSALSYCWGDKDELERNRPLKLTASTFDHLLSDIPVSKLPLTLKQAVTVCGYLGLEYIWIDALCIIQTDTSDWATESKKMTRVYTVATVTIITAFSASCHSGFLTRDLNSLTLRTRLSPPNRVVAQKNHSSGFHSAISVAVDAVDERGWTLQEELLSELESTCICHQRLDIEKAYQDSRLESWHYQQLY